MVRGALFAEILDMRLSGRDNDSTRVKRRHIGYDLQTDTGQLRGLVIAAQTGVGGKIVIGPRYAGHTGVV